MSSGTNQIEWCTVRLGDDYNWWVVEVSDEIHWDVDGLSIIDPRQVAHIVEVADALQDYNFDPDLLASAFIPFRIDKDLGDGYVRLVRSKEPLLDSDDPLFGLPDIVDEENGPYADFITNITKARVALLNDLIDFEQNFTVDELEEAIREEENNSFIEGSAIHMFNEVTTILDYIPAGWELDGDGDDEVNDGEDDEVADLDDYEVDEEADEEVAKKLGASENLKWDDEDEEDDNEDAYEGGPPDEESEEEAKA